MLINNNIQYDTKQALKKLNMTLAELRARRGFKSITDKKKLIYYYLRNIQGYSWSEIADYCHKDHSTLIKTCQKHVDFCKEYVHILS